MQKWYMSPIDTGRWQKCKVGDIWVPKDWWNIAQDLLVCRILSNDPYAVDVYELSTESYKEADELLSVAIKEFDVSKPATHRGSFGMFQAVLGSTVNQAEGLTIKLVDCQSAAQVLFTDWACEVTPDKDATRFQTISNDDHQKLASRLICSFWCRYHHSDCESEVRLNVLILLMSWQSTSIPKKMFLHRSLAVVVAKTLFKK